MPRSSTLKAIPAKQSQSAVEPVNPRADALAYLEDMQEKAEVNAVVRMRKTITKMLPQRDFRY